MKLSDLKQHLNTINSLDFMLPNNEFIPKHFHITEIGFVIKHFIDCSGEIRKQKSATVQIWVANDVEHRLKPSGLLKIIALSEKVLGDEDLDIEVEYQTGTIGKYSLETEGENFILVATQTDCLAKEKCNNPVPKPEKQLSTLVTETGTCCTPGGGCC